MSTVWATIAAAALASGSHQGGRSGAGRRAGASRSRGEVIAMLVPALLAALVVTGALAEGARLEPFDPKAAGVAATAAALALRVPLLPAIALAAVVTACPAGARLERAGAPAGPALTYLPGRYSIVMFSTKAEYGVRVMAHLAAHDGGRPVSLAAIAEAESLPLAYLEHLVQRLRRAELVESRRGARGGYSLARSAGEITMAEVVRALEGDIAPIECISEHPDGRLVCSREAESDHVCPTKVLWTRVQGSIVRTLNELKLSDIATAPPRIPNERRASA